MMKQALDPKSLISDRIYHQKLLRMAAKVNFFILTISELWILMTPQGRSKYKKDITGERKYIERKNKNKKQAKQGHC